MATHCSRYFRPDRLAAQWFAAGLLCLLCACMPEPTAAAPGAMPWGTIVCGSVTEPERLAIVDLQRYVVQVTGVVPELVKPGDWQAHPRPAVLAGTPQSNPLTATAKPADADLGAEGYLLANVKPAGTPCILAMGGQPAGAVNAVYGLLREAGFGFYLGSEAAPASLPDRLPHSPVVRKPAFAIRGILPWYNFFDSPTAWDPVDHRAVVDELIREGANFIGFHTYDSEPFAACDEGGHMAHGARLHSTKDPTWGCTPLETKDFAGGTDKLFATDYFGAATTEIADPDAAIRREQAVMRDALDYAHQRGLHTCIGFEVTGDPTDPQERDTFLRRFNYVLDAYPSIDYLWIWEPEAWGARGFVPPRSSRSTDALSLYAAARRPLFQRAIDAHGAMAQSGSGDATKEARALEGARLEQYAQLALHALAHRQGTPKLVISGWGGETRLLSAEYYAGLDKLLPPDVVFSSLDFIVPVPHVDSIYRELPPSRERWPIPWLEHDGDQWHPQPDVHIYEKLAADAWQGGSQGILGIHWRTRGIEENFAFLMDFAWQPGLTAEEFFRQLADRCYPPAIASEMAAIHSDLDSLGYRWIGGAGESECAPFKWGSGTAEGVAKLQAIRGRIAALLPQAGVSKPRVEWLLNRIDWIPRFQDAEVAAVKATQLLAAHKPAEALQALDDNLLNRALQAYAERVTTRGEYGVLATINTKAVVAWRQLRRDCLAALGKPDQPTNAAAWQPAPTILLPRFLGSVVEGRQLMLRPLCLGGGRAWIHYRRLGATTWTSAPLTTVRGWVEQAVIPAATVRQPGIELGFSFDASAQQPMAFGPVAVTVMPPTTVQSTPIPTAAVGRVAPLGLTVRQGAIAPVELHWNELPQADYFKVFVDGNPAAETAVPFYPDIPDAPAQRRSYTVEAWRDGKLIERAEASAVLPAAAVTEKPQPALAITRDGLVLSLPAPQSPDIGFYRVQPVGDALPAKPLRLPARTGDRRLTFRPTRAAKCDFDITAMNWAGATGPTVRASIQWPGLTEKVLDWPMTQPPAPCRVMGAVRFDSTGTTFSGGYIDTPHQPAMNLGMGMTLSMEFRADSVQGMPVLLCHGHWQQDGWFVQILGGRLMIRTPGADAVGPVIKPGKWYTIKWDFDGANHSLTVDGELVQKPAPLIPRPQNSILRIGQYDSVEPVYAFHGCIRNIKITSTEPKLVNPDHR